MNIGGVYLRDYKSEDEKEKLTKGKFQTKLDNTYLHKFDGIKKASFLRWCVDNGIVERYKKEN